MLHNILDWLKQLFGIAPRKTDEEQAAEARHQRAYEDAAGFNVTALVAGKVANIVCGDSTIEVIGEGKRAEYMREAMERVCNQLHTIAARALGTGGVWLVPYNVGGNVYVDVIEQPRFFVVKQRGTVPVQAQYVAESRTIGYHDYARFVSCTLLDDKQYVIEHRATRDGVPIALSEVDEWAEITSPTTFEHVEQMLLAFIPCPTDERGSLQALRGVPLTYGQDELVAMMNTILRQIPDEYRLKKAFVGASSLLFDGKGRLPDDGLYKTFEVDTQIGDAPFWEVFSPEIRHTAYFAGLDYLMGLLEKSIGLNKGVLTDLDTVDATATAIKRSTFDTFNVVDAMRRNLEIGLHQIAYAIDVFATGSGVMPKGNGKAGYELAFEWSYGLLENTQETWSQYMGALSAGVLRPEEVRAWLLDISEEEALEGLPQLLDDSGVVGE